ncbi:complement component 1 Q subcomponent-binding protein, mitochondrial, partial [Plectropomus leopardus]|uniref:complement component 1 Q subcomponent-binding protein, mitochondrial n=1 Tax=Plectropomus leopardus TaxID=160734 RepID=UPI001C4CF862
DKAFSDFLSDEIKEEKKIQKSKTLPKMSGGWELEMNGTEAKLTRSVAGEKITVTFNVNNSIPPNFEEEADQGQQKSPEEPEIVSTPNFVVEVTKQAAKHSLVFDCQFPEDEMGRGEGEEESDIFAIREVSFQPEGDSEWKETSYTLNTDSLDWVRAPKITASGSQFEFLASVCLQKCCKLCTKSIEKCLTLIVFIYLGEIHIKSIIPPFQLSLILFLEPI